MPIKNVQPFKAKDNAYILNAIRKHTSTTYQDRIPEVTKANMQETLQELTSNAGLRNEFVSALVNRIGLVIARNNSWTNPFGKFKQGMLQYGDTIEEIQIGLVKAHAYDHNRDYLEKDLFGREQIDVQSSFHKINREDFYKITIDEPTLTRAFLEPMGLSSFIVQLMEAPATSDNWDEYTLTVSLFKEYELNGGFFKVNVPNVTATSSDSADAKAALRAIRTMSGKLPFLSTLYNAAGMPVSADPEDLELFCTPEFKAAIDVEALAAAFNVSYADVDTRMTLVDDFKIPGCQAILTTRDFFVMADVRFETTSVQNAVGLYSNHFLHHWEVISTSRFVPAVMFTTDAGTVVVNEDVPVAGVSDLSVYDSDMSTVTTLQRGENYRVVGNAITEPTGGVNNAIRLELVGAQSQYSYVANTGALHIGLDEESTSVTILATATDDNDFTKTATYTVVGDKAILWPNPHVQPDSDKDGLIEVIPEAPARVDETNKIKIPSTDGVIYKQSTTVVTGTTVTITADATFTATAEPGHELAAGATASWTITKL